MNEIYFNGANQLWPVDIPPHSFLLTTISRQKQVVKRKSAVCYRPCRRAVFESGKYVESFSTCFCLGVYVLELGVMMTTNRIYVTHHRTNDDGNISLFSNDYGLVHEMTYEALQDYNFGYKFKNEVAYFPYKALPNEAINGEGLNIPRLEDHFIEFGDQVKYMIEIKSDYAVWGDAVAQQLEKTHPSVSFTRPCYNRGF